MTRAEWRKIEREYQVVMARIRRLASMTSKRAIATADAAMKRMAQDMGKIDGTRTMTKADAAVLIKRVGRLLDDFEQVWRATTARATAGIVKGAVAGHKAQHLRAIQTVGLKSGGVATRLGVVPERTASKLFRLRGRKTLRDITRGHVADIDAGIRLYIEKTIGRTMSDDAIRGISRLLRGDLPFDLGGATKRELGAAASLPGKVERLIVTESFEAYRQGQALALAAGPVKMVAYWETAEDEIVCPICEGIQDKDVGYGRGWYPPEEWPANPHPWCRCGQGEIRILGER